MAGQAIDPREMAAAPLNTAAKADKGNKTVNLLDTLGQPTFIAGDGRTYPRQTGFGANRKAHPDGGTNRTAATVVFKPFKGSDVSIEARIYHEQWEKDGQKFEDFAISFGKALQVERKDAAGNAQLDALKLAIWDAFVPWYSKRDKDAPVVVARASKFQLPKSESK